jgi:hypothetical protein
MITGGGSRFADDKKLVMSCSNQCGRLEFSLSLLALTELAVQKPCLAKHFCVTKGVFNFHATETPWMAAKVFHFLTSSAGTLLSVSCNHKCTTHS